MPSQEPSAPQPPYREPGGASLADRPGVQAAIVVVGGLLVPALVTLVLWLSADRGTDEPRGGEGAGPAASVPLAGGGSTPAASSPPGDASAPPRAADALHLTFDEALVGTPIEGWIVDPALAFTVAPHPTAEERSALLETDGEAPASACYPLFSSGETVVFEATFQLVGAAEEQVPLLDLATSGDTALTLTAAGDRLAFGEWGTDLVSEGWYRWSILVGSGGSYEMTLSRDGTDEVVRAAGESSAIVIESFCATVRRGMSLYLDRVALTPGLEGGG